MKKNTALHILVIDDDEALTRLIQRILSEDNYHVTVANTLRELTLILSDSVTTPHFFDLVLLDLQIPNSSGFEMYQLLRDSSKATNSPILILSGVSDITTRVKLLDMGVDDYIVKPFSMDELLTQTAIHIKLNQLRRAKQAAEERVELQARQLSAINEITHRATEHLNLRLMVQEVAHGIIQHFDCQSCTIYLYEPETESLALTVGLPHGSKSIEDLPEIIAKVSETLTSITTETELAVPITRDNVLLGILFIQHPPQSSIADTLQSLEILAVHLTTIITNSYLFEDIQERNQQLFAIAKENQRLLQMEQEQRQQAELLHQMAQIISSSLNMEKVLKAATDSLRAIFQVEMGSIILHEENSDHLVFASSLDNSPTLARTRLPTGTGIVGQVMRQGKPLIINDAQKHPSFFPALDKLTGQMTKMVLCVPLIARDEVIGAIQLINKKTNQFTEVDLTTLSSVATSIAIAIDNATLYSQHSELVTQVRQSHEQLVQSEKMAGIGRLAAALAHEINNPLQAIHSCLQLITQFELEKDKQDEYVQMADEEVERLIDIVTRILDFSRASTADFQRTNINKLLSQVMRLASKHISHHKWDVQQILSSDMIPVDTMPDQIAQVFLSIILNAFDAMPESGTLTIHTRTEGNWAEVTFQDTGIGMSREVRDRIFEPFFSTKESASGLGLTISYSIMEKHGGAILVESEPGQGSLLTVRLPGANSLNSSNLDTR
jgi:signal transduction histidine kinase/DNA-binding response OmpR family regulator